MIQSPHKFSTRSFLKSLVENNFLSQSGKEFSEFETKDLLIEKESRLALKDYAKSFKSYCEEKQFDELRRAQQSNSDYARESSEEKSQSIVYAPSSSPLFPLIDTENQKQTVKHNNERNKDGGNMKTVYDKELARLKKKHPSYEIVENREKSLKNIKKEISHLDQLLKSFSKITRNQ